MMAFLMTASSRQTVPRYQVLQSLAAAQPPSRLAPDVGFVACPHQPAQPSRLQVAHIQMTLKPIAMQYKRTDPFVEITAPTALYLTYAMLKEAVLPSVIRLLKRLVLPSVTSLLERLLLPCHQCFLFSKNLCCHHLHW